jgi:clan AA aspartic protease
MIVGSVQSNDEAVLTLTLRGPTSEFLEIQAVIDIGFNSWLTLSPTSIQFLKLPLIQKTRYFLADGSETVTNLCKAEIQWHDEWHEILVVEMDGGPLLGMAMLRGSSLHMDVIDGGRVQIQPLNA